GLRDHKTLLQLGRSMTAPGRSLPRWAYEILMSPQTRSPLTEQQGRLVAPDGEVAGNIVEGIACFPIPTSDRSIEFYRAVGGALFHERTRHRGVSELPGRTAAARSGRGHCRCRRRRRAQCDALAAMGVSARRGDRSGSRRALPPALAHYGGTPRLARPAAPDPSPRAPTAPPPGPPP